LLQNVDQMSLVKKGALDNSLNAVFLIPLNSYQGQYREMNDRIKERNRREQEMYKCIEQRDKYQKNNDARFNASEQRVTASTQAYEELNKEIIDDVPKLIADAEIFFMPLLNQLILNQAQFWALMAQHSAATAAQVDPAKAYIPQIEPVITSKQTSSMTRKYHQITNPWGTDINRPAIGSAPPGNWGSDTPADSAPNPFGGAAATTVSAQPLPPRPTRGPVPTPPSVQARGLWDFTANDATELSFKSGDTLTIIEQSGDWWQA